MEETSTSMEVHHNKKPLLKNKRFLVAIGVIASVLLLFLTFALTKLNNLASPENKILAKVGNENIYQADLDYAIAKYPTIPNQDIKKLLMDKIIKDSTILQIGHKDGIISLNDTVFNSKIKDQSKRLELINKVAQNIENNRVAIKGDIVAIWFFNVSPGSAGYENGKKIAYKKITGLYEDVKNGKITIQQAGEAIKNDANLEKVDSAYKTNALVNFAKAPNEKITFDEKFNEILWNLKPGEISELYTAKDKDMTKDKMIDAVYMFAQISEKNNNATSQTLEQWYSERKGQYEVKYY